MKSSNLIIALAVLVCAPLGCLAQDGSYKGESIDGVHYHYDKYFELEITPASIGQLSSDDTIFSIDFERKSRNAENFYYRACVLWFARSQDQRDALWHNLNDWEQCEIEDFPQDEVAELLERFQPVLEQIQKASERRNCNWDFDLENMDFSQYMEMDLHELHTLRSISQLLRLRTRLEIARDDFPAAEETISQHIKLGTDVGKIPFLVAGIVGESIISSALSSSIEMSSRPGAPNRYHALQSIPTPVIDFYSMVSTESYLVGKTFPFLYTPEKLDLTAKQWRDVFSDALKHVDAASGRKIETESDSERESRTALILARLYPIAKRELIQSGWDANKVDAMPVGQVVAIQTRRVWDKYADLLASKQQFTSAVAAEVQQRQIKKIENEGYDVPGQRGDFPIIDLAPPLLDLEIIPSRTRLVNRQIAMLQVIAKLRDYAAANGRLPSQQEFTSMDPIHDPRTGLPFEYVRDSENSAVLQTAPYSNSQDPSYRRINIQMNFRLKN